MRNKQKIFLYGLLAPAVLALLVLCFRTFLGASSLTPSAAENFLTISYQKKPGDLIRSTIQLNNKSELNISRGNSAGSPGLAYILESQLKAELEEIVLDDDGVSSRSLLRVKNPELMLEFNHPDKDRIQKEAVDGLLAGAWILRDHTGMVLDVKVPSGDTAREFFYLLAKASEYALPVGAHEGPWTAVQEDQNGRYEAYYNPRQENRGQWTIQKTREKYQKLGFQMKSSVGRDDVQGKASGGVTLRYDEAKAQILTAEGTDHLDYFNELKQKIGFATLAVRWTFLSKKIMTASELSAEKQTAETIFSGIKSYQETAAEFKRKQKRLSFEKRLSGQKLEDLIAGYREFERTSDTEAAGRLQTELFLKLRAYIYLHPEKLNDIAGRMAGTPLNTAFDRFFVTALADNSSPAAQEALVTLLLAKRGDETAAQLLISSMGFVQNPGDSIVSALQTLRAEGVMKGMADLALGAVGAQMGKMEDAGARERHDDLQNGLLRDAETAKSSRELIHHLGILGNLGSPEILTFVQQNITNPDPEVRREAATALRNLENSEAADLLFHTLKEDGDDQVRMAASGALLNFPPDDGLLLATSQAMDQEKNGDVRIQLLQVLARCRYVNDEMVKNLLEKTSRSDVNPQVQSYATNLLTQWGTI